MVFFKMGTENDEMVVETWNILYFVEKGNFLKATFLLTNQLNKFRNQIKKKTYFVAERI